MAHPCRPSPRGHLSSFLMLIAAPLSQPRRGLVVDEVHALVGIVAQVLEPMRIPLGITAAGAGERLVATDGAKPAPGATAHGDADVRRRLVPRRHRRRARRLDVPDLAP